MNKSDFEQRLTEYLRQLGGEEASGVTRATKIFEEKILDSMKVLDLMAFIEAVLTITIPDKTVILENFSSIAKISDAFYAHRSQYATKKK